MSALHEQLLHLARQYCQGNTEVWKAMVEMAHTVSSPEPIATLPTERGDALLISKLDLSLQIRLLAGASHPQFLECARLYPYGGFQTIKDFLQTCIVSADGRQFDISNQFQHSFVMLTSEQRVAGFHIINWNNDSVTYGRMLLVDRSFWRDRLGLILLGLQLEEAAQEAVSIVRHKVHRSNALFIGLLRRIGHTRFMAAPGVADFYLVEGSVPQILAGACEAGYRPLLNVT